MKETILNTPAVQFLYQAFQKNADLHELIDNPKKIAKDLDLKLSKDVSVRIEKLKAIKKEKGAGEDDLLKSEIISFYNKVLIDGRYIEEWVGHPRKVAKILGLKISDEAMEKIEELKFDQIIDVNTNVEKVAGIGLAIVITVVLVFIPSSSAYSIQSVIVDKSGRTKL